MGSTVVHPTNSWTILGSPASITGTYVEVDYNGAVGAIASPIEVPTIPAGATITNILMTVTCQNDNGSGFIPLGHFQPQSTRDVTGVTNVGGFGSVADASGTTLTVGTSPAPITYDFAALWAAGLGGIPSLTTWVTDAQNAGDPLNVVVRLQQPFHNPGWLRYYIGATEFLFTIEWTSTTTFAPPLRLTNRDDVFSSAPSLTRPRSQQGGNRLTGYL